MGNENSAEEELYTPSVNNTGDPVPYICLKNQNNETVCLNDMNGRWKIIYFYPKDNTPGCTKEAEDFSNANEAFRK